MIQLTDALFAAAMTAQTTMTDAILEVISLDTYLKWIGLCEDAQEAQGWRVGRLTNDAAHWAEIQVYTAMDLAQYLDECVANEVRKDAMA